MWYSRRPIDAVSPTPVGTASPYSSSLGMEYGREILSGFEPGLCDRARQLGSVNSSARSVAHQLFARQFLLNKRTHSFMGRGGSNAGTHIRDVAPSELSGAPKKASIGFS